MIPTGKVDPQVLTIPRGRKSWGRNLPCDNFLYGFKVAASGRAGCGAAPRQTQQHAVGDKKKATASAWSITTAVCEPLCGSTPITTAAMTCPFSSPSYFDLKKSAG
jgi:hypothetical protein